MKLRHLNPQTQEFTIGAKKDHDRWNDRRQVARRPLGRSRLIALTRSRTGARKFGRPFSL